MSRKRKKKITYEIRYAVMEEKSLEVHKVFKKEDAYRIATEPGVGVIDWTFQKNPQSLFVSQDCGAWFYLKNGKCFSITSLEEIFPEDLPDPSECVAIVCCDCDISSFWSEDGQIRIFASYDKAGLISAYWLTADKDDEPAAGDREISFEDLYRKNPLDLDDSYRENIPGTWEYKRKHQSSQNNIEKY